MACSSIEDCEELPGAAMVSAKLLLAEAATTAGTALKASCLLLLLVLLHALVMAASEPLSACVSRACAEAGVTPGSTMLSGAAGVSCHL
jgi:hypothetical protein